MLQWSHLSLVIPSISLLSALLQTTMASHEVQSKSQEEIATAVSFLDLPNEIQDEILRHAILATTAIAPVDASSLANFVNPKVANASSSAKHVADELLGGAARGNDVEPYQPVYRGKKLYRGRVFFKPLHGHVLSLLPVNKQIHVTVKEIISRNFKQDINDCKADVIYTRNGGLWTTWLSAPFPTTRFHTVHAQFRMYKFPGTWDSSQFDKNLWQGGDGGPPRGVWDFFDLLVGFLVGRAGPWLPQGGAAPNMPPVDPHNTIQHLVLDVLSATEEDILPIFPSRWSRGLEERFEERRRQSEPQDIPDTKRAALRFADFVYGQLGGLVNLGYHTVGYGEVLIERIGDIEIRVDGEKYMVVDIPSIFAGLPHGDHWGTFERAEKRAKYFCWKRSASEKRRTAGFSIVEPEKKESDEGLW